MTPTPTFVRYRVVLVTALMAVLLYLDRFCISIAEIYIKEDLWLSDTQIGWMLGAFFWTYALGQVPAGWLTDRFGARLMLTTYIVAWSLLTAMTGLATGFLVLIALRLGFGFAQAGAYPAGGSLLSKWMPASSRGTASSIVSAGGRLGGAVAPVAAGFLIVMLVPVDVESRLEPGDLLRPTNLCFTLAGHAPEHVKTFAARIVDRMPTETRALVERKVHEKLTEALSSDVKRTVEAEVAFTDAELESITQALNARLTDRDLYEEALFKNVSLPDEAERLRDATQSLDERQLQRLNRLLLEGMFPADVRKVYGAGWRGMMLIAGLCGIPVALLFVWVFRNRPSEHPRCNAEEVALIEGPLAGKPRPTRAVGGVPIKELIRSRSMWLNALSQATTNIGWVFLVTWLPRYLQDVHQAPIKQRAFMTFLPIAAGWFGMLAGGRLTDALTSSIGLRWGRALPMSLAKFMAAAAYLYCIAFEPSVWFAVAAFSFVAFSTDMSVGPLWAYCQDVGGRHVGSVLGWGNMWGNLGAAITPPLLIWIVGESSNWTGAFWACAIAFCISGAAALGIDATKRVAPEETE